MKQTLDVTKHFPIVIICMAVLAVLFQVIGIASSGWLVARFNMVKSRPNSEHNNDTVSGMHADNRLISPSSEPISRTEHEISRRMIPEKENENDTNNQDGLPNVNNSTPEKNTTGGPKKIKVVKPLQPMVRPHYPKPRPVRPKVTMPSQPKPSPQPPLKRPERPDKKPIDNGGKITPVEPRPIIPRPRPQPPKKPSGNGWQIIRPGGTLTENPTVPKFTLPIRPKPRPQKTTSLPERPQKPSDNEGNIRPDIKDNSKPDKPREFQPMQRPIQPRLQTNLPKKLTDDDSGNVKPEESVDSKSKESNVSLSVNPNERRLFPKPLAEHTQKPFDDGGKVKPQENDVSVKTNKTTVNGPHFQAPESGKKHVPGVEGDDNNDDDNDDNNDTGIQGEASDNGSSQKSSENKNAMKFPDEGSQSPKNDETKTVTRSKQSKTSRQSRPPLKRRGNLSSMKTIGSIRMGLWTSMSCQVNTKGDEKCTQHSIRDGLILFRSVMKKPMADDVGGVATWNDLRVETIFALCAGAIGFVGTLLTVKPFCLKGRQRVTTIIGVSGLVLSCILFLVPITRVASINHSLKNSRMHENEVVQVDMPWAAAISGIGACLAFITAGFLVFFTWSDERQKWNKFKEDRTIVFKNNDKPRDERQASEDKDKAGSYDNVATMNDK